MKWKNVENQWATVSLTAAWPRSHEPKRGRKFLVSETQRIIKSDELEVMSWIRNIAMSDGKKSQLRNYWLVKKIDSRAGLPVSLLWKYSTLPLFCTIYFKLLYLRVLNYNLWECADYYSTAGQLLPQLVSCLAVGCLGHEGIYSVKGVTWNPGRPVSLQKVSEGLAMSRCSFLYLSSNLCFS